MSTPLSIWRMPKSTLKEIAFKGIKKKKKHKLNRSERKDIEYLPSSQTQMHTCSGVFLWCSATSATADSFSIGPCTDLDLLNDILGVPGSSSPDPLSDRFGLLVGTPNGV